MRKNVGFEILLFFPSRIFLQELAKSKWLRFDMKTENEGELRSPSIDILTFYPVGVLFMEKDQNPPRNTLACVASYTTRRALY